MQNDTRNAPAPADDKVKWITRGGFVGILDRLGVSLVLSTRPNHIVFLGAADGQLTFSATQMIQPMGLAMGADRIAVATTSSITVFANLSRIAHRYPGARDTYDAFFAPRTIHLTGECYMHDMVFAGNAIIGANTNFSCICRVDGTNSFTPLWMPSFISQMRPEDRCHLNGFAACEGQLRYVTAMSSSDAPLGWRDLPDNEGILIDVQANAILSGGLCMPHSPRLFGDDLYILNGGMGQVLRIDRTNGRATLLATLPAFTHGLAAHDGILFVGMSQDRVTRKKGPPPIAGQARAMVAGVAAIDMRSGEILGGLDFTDGVTEVYDVQTLPGFRRAKMQNLLAPDGHVAIDTPAESFWGRRPEDGLQHVQDIVGAGTYHIRIRTAASELK